MSQPGWIVDNIVSGLQNLVAMLELIVADNSLDAIKYANFSVQVATAAKPSLSTAAPTSAVIGIGNTLVALYGAVPLAVSPVTGLDASLPAGLFAVSSAIGDAMDPSQAVSAFASAVDAIADVAIPVASVNRVNDAANGQLVARISRYTLMVPSVQCLVGMTFADRPSAITARADLVERIERELGECRGAGDAGVARALTQLRDRGVDYLSRAIINATPIATVSANRSLPSLWWAWRLYGDPTRAADLIARNNVLHASYMPLQFEALAS